MTNTDGDGDSCFTISSHRLTAKYPTLQRSEMPSRLYIKIVLNLLLGKNGLLQRQPKSDGKNDHAVKNGAALLHVVTAFGPASVDAEHPYCKLTWPQERTYSDSSDLFIFN